MTAASQTANRLDITCPAIERQAAKTLSGGNQQKVVLGKWLLNRPQVLLLDEPTRGVDVGAKTEIYELIAQLAADGAGVLVVSSEHEELIGLCDRILVMVRGEIRSVVDRANFNQQDLLQSAFGQGATA